MTLLSNMSIQRTQSSMNSSSGAGIYRYSGKDCILVDNENYRIGLQYNPDALTKDADQYLTINPGFFCEGANIHITTNEYDQLVISADMYQSPFEEGDKAKYDLACTNLYSLVNTVSLQGDRIGTLDTAINGSGGLVASVASIDASIISLGQTDESLGNRLTTVETALNSEGGVLDDITALQTLTGADGHSLQISQLRTDLTTAEGNISTLQQSVSELTGTPSELGSLSQRITAVDGRVDGVLELINGTEQVDGLDDRLTDAESDISGLQVANTTMMGYIQQAQDDNGTNTGRINDINTRLTLIEEQGIANYAERLGTLEDAFLPMQQSFETIEGAVSTQADTISDLNAAVNGENGIDDRVEALESYVTSNDDDISNISSINTRVSDLESLRITDSAAIQTNTDNLSTLNTNYSTFNYNVTNSLSSLGTRLNAVEGAISDFIGGLGDAFTIFDAPVPVAAQLDAEANYDISVRYYFKDADSYSTYVDTAIRVGDGDNYDSQITYYYIDNNTIYPYTFSTQEQWEEDIANGVYYVPAPVGIDVYTYDSGTDTYSVVNANYLDMEMLDNEEYYVKDVATYSKEFKPVFAQLTQAALYDNNIQYYTYNVAGDYVPYTYDANNINGDVANGLFYISNLPAAFTAGLYSLQPATPDDSSLTLSIQHNGIFTVDSGIGNRLTVMVNADIVARSTAAERSSVSITIPVAIGDVVTASVTPANHGTGIIGIGSVRYFAD